MLRRVFASECPEANSPAPRTDAQLAMGRRRWAVAGSVPAKADFIQLDRFGHGSSRARSASRRCSIDFCRKRELAFPFALPVHSQLDEREGIVCDVGLVDGFPLRGWAVRRQEDSPATIARRFLARVVKVVREVTRRPDRAYVSYRQGH